jgi:hypothetical protein
MTLLSGVHGKALRCRVWWGLQGGVTVDSPAMHVLTAALLSGSYELAEQNTRGGMTNTALLSRFAILEAAPLHELGARRALTRVHVVMLQPHERTAYTTLHDTERTSPLDLTHVCAGSLKPLEDEYMTVVEDVLDAIPLGLREIENSYMTMEDDVSDESDESDESGSSESGSSSSSSNSSESGSGDRDGAGAHDDAAAEAEAEAEPCSDTGTDTIDAPRSSPPPVAPTLELRGTTSHGLPFVITTDFTSFIQKKEHDIQERRDFFRKTALALAAGKESAPSCPICLSARTDCLFVCGHMMCQACVVQLINTARDKALEEYGDESGDVACPTCRCDLFKSSIYWITGIRPRLSSKADALRAVLRAVVDRQENAVVLAEPTYLLRHVMMPQMQASGLLCLMLAGAKSKQLSKMCEWLEAGRKRGGRAKGRVLFAEIARLKGIKLPAVEHVVLLHPLAPTAKLSFENDVLSAFVSTACAGATAGIGIGVGVGVAITVHHLVAHDTIEAASVPSPLPLSA